MSWGKYPVGLIKNGTCTLMPTDCVCVYREDGLSSSLYVFALCFELSNLLILGLKINYQETVTPPLTCNVVPSEHGSVCMVLVVECTYYQSTAAQLVDSFVNVIFLIAS